jgi:hypothetical protein
MHEEEVSELCIAASAFGKAHRATYEILDPWAQQIDEYALDSLSSIKGYLRQPTFAGTPA